MCLGAGSSARTWSMSTKMAIWSRQHPFAAPPSVRYARQGLGMPWVAGELRQGGVRKLYAPAPQAQALASGDYAADGVSVRKWMQVEPQALL